VPAQANATLTTIVGPATGDDWDDAATPGASKLTGGNVRVYVRESVQRRTGAGDVDVIGTRTVILETVDLDRLALAVDDVVTVETDGGAVLERPVAAVARRELAGLPSSVVTSRLELVPE
jgi:hypothetical protein